MIFHDLGNPDCSAGFRREPKGVGTPPKAAPRHVHMFSHMCDMCVPLNTFIDESLFAGVINYIGGQTEVFHLNLI